MMSRSCSISRTGRPSALSIALALVAAGPAVAQEDPPDREAPEATVDGARVWGSLCAECHAAPGASRAPGYLSLTVMSPRAIVQALEAGRMRAHGQELDDRQVVAVAEWLTGKTLTETRLPEAAFCATGPRGDAEVHWSGWGGGDGEAGYADAASAGLTAADLENLELAWTFGFPEADQVRSKPAVVGDRVIVGSAYGEVYSLDLETGCVHWIFPADAAVRGAIAVADGPEGRQTAFFADFITNAYAIDAATGELLWKQRAGDHFDHSNTGSVAVHDGRVFVPVSSMEVASAMNPEYECCTSAGAVVALSAQSGAELWRRRSIGEEPREVGTNEKGTKIFAPSGAPIWSSPTVDAVRGLLYVGTGENYTRPATTTSDALMALDMETGEVVWSFQASEGDAWNLACGNGANYQNCPDAAGPDHDFGMAPIIVTRGDGSQLLVAGQKAGVVWALDPDAGGQVVWAQRIGRGSALGGIHWGLAADGSRVYAPNSDQAFATVIDPRSQQAAQANARDPATPGVYALELGGGEVLWRAEPDPSVCAGRPGCMPFFSSAPTAIEGAVLTGSLDGHMRAFSTEDGSVLWDVDTAREFGTVNGIPGKGGALDGPGPVVTRGWVLVNSGYGFVGQMPGNVLLAYRLKR